MIAKRTRDRLAAAKARGTALGGPPLDKAREKATTAVVAAADQHAANVLSSLRGPSSSGHTLAPSPAVLSW